MSDSTSFSEVTFFSVVNDLHNELDRLRQQLDRYEAALREYATRENWNNAHHKLCNDIWMPTDNGWEPAEEALK